MNDHKTILYVEDEEHIRNELVEILELDYPNVLIASNGKEGLELYKQHLPDLVISDIQMPQMDGMTMCEEIKKIDKNVPIILTTAFNERTYKERADELSIVDFIAKPISVSDLYSCIDACFERKTEKGS